MNLKSYVYSLLIMGGIVLVVIGFMNRLADVDNFDNSRIRESSYDYQTFNRTDTIMKDFNKTKEGFEEIIGKDTESGTEFPTYQTGIWQKIKNVIFGTTNVAKGTSAGIVGTFSLGFDIIEDVAKELGVSGIIVSVIIGLLTVTLVFFLTKFIFGREV